MITVSGAMIAGSVRKRRNTVGKRAEIVIMGTIGVDLATGEPAGNTMLAMVAVTS